MNELINAKLVYHTGMPKVIVPEEMGSPRDDQMQGSPEQQLSELALRICYDSLGIDKNGKPRKSRASADAHRHILEVGHLSVYEHFNDSFIIESHNTPEALKMLCSRPGVHITQILHNRITFTANIRAILEWEDWGVETDTGFIGLQLLSHLGREAPMILPHFSKIPGRRIGQQTGFNLYWNKVITNPEEFWISLYISGSRGLSHELVRHGDFSAISQRSTRYCNENDSQYVTHPLILDYMERHPNDGKKKEMSDLIARAERDNKDIYKAVVQELEEDWLTPSPGNPITQTHARKQARGAARGYLGNALQTELIFSATAAQWKRMIKARLSEAADAEIRELFTKIFGVFKQNPSLELYFKDLEVEPAEDGLGYVLKGGGNK